MAGLNAPTRGKSSDQVIAGRPSPITGCAARYMSVVPKSASAIPTPHRMKYFHAASSASCVR
jgi:hypothetical protein